MRKLAVDNGWSICPKCLSKFANTDGSLPNCGCDDPDLKTSAPDLLRQRDELLEAAKLLVAHHRIGLLDGVSDTLQPRLDALRAAIANAS